MPGPSRSSTCPFHRSVELGHDREPEPGAGPVRAALGAAVEALEDAARARLGGDSRPRCRRRRSPAGSPSRLELDADPGPRRRVADRVLDQVVEDVGDVRGAAQTCPPAPLADDELVPGRRPPAPPSAGPPPARPRRGRRSRRHAWSDEARASARRSSTSALSRSSSASAFGRLLGCGTALGPDRLEAQLDPRERRPQLMGGVGDEVALGGEVRRQLAGHAVERPPELVDLLRALRARRARRGRRGRDVRPRRGASPPGARSTRPGSTRGRGRPPTTARPISASASQLERTLDSTSPIGRRDAKGADDAATVGDRRRSRAGAPRRACRCGARGRRRRPPRARSGTRALGRGERHSRRGCALAVGQDEPASRRRRPCARRSPTVASPTTAASWLVASIRTRSATRPESTVAFATTSDSSSDVARRSTLSASGTASAITTAARR